MRTLLAITSAAGLLMCALPVLADDTMTRATPTDHQMMKDCIERQKTKDVNMSAAQMKRVCKDELKAQKETGSLPEQPPVDAPQNN